MKIVASSPGDIIIEFMMTDTVTGKANNVYIPVKTLSASKTIDVSKEYGVGSHQDYAEVVGKIGYEGDFTVGTWFVDSEENPESWNALIRNNLTYSTDEGLPKEFEIRIQARSGTAMTRQGTGTYGTNLSNSDQQTIETYKRCILKSDGTDVPEVGSTVSKKYSFSSMRRDPM
jgi:hypothetical protein